MLELDLLGARGNGSQVGEGGVVDHLLPRAVLPLTVVLVCRLHLKNGYLAYNYVIYYSMLYLAVSKISL